MPREGYTSITVTDEQYDTIAEHKPEDVSFGEFIAAAVSDGDVPYAYGTPDGGDLDPDVIEDAVDAAVERRIDDIAARTAASVGREVETKLSELQY